MNLFVEYHQYLIKTLLGSGVDFIVIGGYSVIFHGYRRTTGDIDIWLKPDNDNKKKVLTALRVLGYDEEEIAPIASINFCDTAMFSIGEDPERADFLTAVSLVKYEDADKQKVVADVDGLQVPFLHLNHLVLSKMNTGRTKDQADIDELQLIQQAKRSL